MNGAIELPPGVCVVAASANSRGLDSQSEDFTTIACEAGEPLPIDRLRAASIVVLEIDPSSQASMERLSVLKQQAPYLPVIAGVRSIDLAGTRKLLRQGVRDVVALPFSIDELLPALVDVANDLQQAADTAVKPAPFIVLIKSIGGSGSTTIATHLAASIADEDARVCLFDLDLQSGDASYYLGSQPPRNISDLLDAKDRLDADLLEAVVDHNETGVDIVAAPSEIVPIESVDFARLSSVIELARREYDYVIVDLPSDFTNWVLSTVFAADLVLQINTLTIPSLRNARRQMDFLRSMGLSPSMLGVVINQCEKKMFKTVSVANAEEVLKCKVLATIAADTSLVREAQNSGTTADQIRSKSHFAKDISNLTDRVFDQLVEAS